MIAAQLEKIEAEDLPQLRERWRARWGDPPRLRSVALLRRLIAWRIQVEACGGLDAGTRKLLRGGASGPESLLAPGTVLTREWQGVRHRVEVTDDGLIHDGRRWSSLSEIARAITGTRWNGPRFFGLREPR
jgi:hypothetical protein